MVPDFGSLSSPDGSNLASDGILASMQEFHDVDNGQYIADVDSGTEQSVTLMVLPKITKTARTMIGRNRR